MTHALESLLGYSFSSPGLLDEALTHPSAMKPYNNQRLEFLGDSVLSLIVAELLYALFPKEPEGDLARRHAALVKGETLVEIALDLELSHHIKMVENDGMVSHGKTAGLEDALEALIGALYLDGGISAAKSFIMQYWHPRAKEFSTPPKDAKTALQEWSQSRSLGLPTYVILKQEGPAHAPFFTIEVQISGIDSQSAAAASKRAAEQLAAEAMLHQVRNL